jgi:two-component system repressor protein LuxO
MSEDSRARVLLVEDTPALARTYQGFLMDEPHRLEAVETGAAALAALEAEPPEAMILDLKLPDMNGMEILRMVGERELDCPVIVITAHGSITTAVEAIRAGASDFLVKPFTAERLRVTLANALEKRALAGIVRTYRETIDRRAFQGFIGSSLAMQAVYRGIESAAASRATVFITGESGTGKEVCANAIHALSACKDGPFVPINCAAIPRDLIESEIFGHVKGAFTGAVADRIGAARQAHGGTLFLDEICEMDPLLQTKLLRFVQTGSFTRVGGTRPEQVEVRFVCATNRDPLAEVAAGRFREDLYYRLHVVPIHLPPLRERGDDILEIARHLLAEYAGLEGKAFTRLSPEAEQALMAHPWPGNVRELQNVLRNAVVLHEGETLEADMLPLRPSGRAAPPNAAAAPPSPIAMPRAGRDAEIGELAKLIRPLAELEREAIERAVELCGGDVRKAAVFLGIAPATIYRRKKTWEEQDAGG